MKTYKIEIQTIFSRFVEVEADTFIEASSMFREKIRNEKPIFSNVDSVLSEIYDFTNVKIIDAFTLSNSNNFFMIDGETVVFRGDDIKSKVVPITPQVANLITINDIPSDEYFEFSEDVDFEIFSLLYYSKSREK